MKFVKGQRVKILHSGDYFYDTGKIGTIVSQASPSYWYIYIKGAENNKVGCVDDFGYQVTWQLKERDFMLLEPDGQLLFEFMYD